MVVDHGAGHGRSVPQIWACPMGTEVGGSCSGAGLDDGCSMGLQGCSIDTIKGMSVGSRGGLLPSIERSMERPGELVLLSSVSGTFPSLTSFFNFIRRFWNQILICLSVSPRVLASSVLRPPVRKWLKWNSFSSSRTCFCEYTVRIRISSDLGIACCAWPWAWPRAAKSAALGVKGGMPGIPPSIPPGMRLLRGTIERAPPWEGGETPPREGGREPLFLTLLPWVGSTPPREAKLRKVVPGRPLVEASLLLPMAGLSRWSLA